MVLKLPRELKTSLIHQIQAYFEMERSETIGELAAENLLDYVIGLVGPVIYNQAVEDVRSVVAELMERMDEEIHALEQPIRR